MWGDSFSRKKKMSIGLVLGVPFLIFLYGAFAFTSQLLYNMSTGRNLFLYAWSNPAVSLGIISICVGIVILFGILNGMRGLFHSTGLFTIIYQIIYVTFSKEIPDYIYSVRYFLVGGIYTFNIPAILFGLGILLFLIIPTVLLLIGIFVKNKIYLAVITVVFSIYLTIFMYLFFHMAVWSWG